MWQLMAAHWKHTWVGGGLPVGDEVGLEPTRAMSVLRRDLECTICREKGRLTEIPDPEPQNLGIALVLFSSQGQGHGFMRWCSHLLLVSEYLLHLPLITDPVREDRSVLFQHLLDQTTPG